LKTKWILLCNEKAAQSLKIAIVAGANTAASWSRGGVALFNKDSSYDEH